MQPVSYTRSSWAALFTLAGHGSVTFGAGRWSLRNGTQSLIVKASSVVSVHVYPGWFWSTLELVTTNRVHRFAGLGHRAANHVRGVSAVVDIPLRVGEGLSSWRSAGKQYLNHYAWAGWRDRQAATREMLQRADLQWLSPDERDRAVRFIEVFDNTKEVARKLNEAYIDRELRECKTWLDAVETNPLTVRQRRAVTTDEDNTLIIAGAGTGKTSVVVAKVGYLVNRLGVPPEEVLLLAYSNAAAKEMQHRVKERVGVDLTVLTFHALGRQIIGQAEQRMPSLSRLAEQPDARTAFIEKTLRGMITLDPWRSLLVHHLTEYLRPYKAMADFHSKHAFIKWLKGANIKSMKGDQVRSLEECIIADWLFINGVEYEYERNYEHDVATPQRRQYRPDFYLVDAGIYIEHFGVSRDGKTAPWIDAAVYRSNMEWKRTTHQHFRTRLVETYSFDKQEGALTDRLADRLAALGVFPKPKAASEIARHFDGRKMISQLARLLATFLQHFKEGRRSTAELRPVIGAPQPDRAASFLRVFERVHEIYEGELRKERAIDYEDMIGRAADHVEAGRYQSPYRYVVVDEFQDTSCGRARLLRAVLDQVPDRRLTCVGDDWQSIYRFAGADITHMTRFGEHFGYTESVSLDESFRFGRRLLEASAQFVQKNPAQLRKTLTSSRDERWPCVVVVPMSKDAGEPSRAIENDMRGILTQITMQAPDGGTVYLLGRYNFNLPGAALSTLSPEFPRLNIEFLTVHRSKGLEADFVIVLDANSGRLGFPSEIDDDPLLSMVLAEPDAMEHAEERRLFYVALTRAKHRVFILTDEARRSVFVEELLGPEYFGLVDGPPEWADRVPCPGCGGTLVRRVNGTTGAAFLGCVDYPYCEAKAPVCTVCEKGSLVLQGTVYQCSRNGCVGRADACPQCRTGMLTRRLNRAQGREFWGCTEWNKTGCNYTRSVG